MKATAKQLAEQTGIPYTQVAGGIKLLVKLGLAEVIDHVVTPNKKGRRQIVYDIQDVLTEDQPDVNPE